MTYRMFIQIASWTDSRLDAILTAARREWNLDWYTGLQPLDLSGYGDLRDGETVELFVDRLASAVMRANEGPCTVYVEAFPLDEMRAHVRRPEDYARLTEVR